MKAQTTVSVMRNGLACTCALKPACQLIGPDDVVQLRVVINSVQQIG